MSLAVLEELYSGKAKTLYRTDDPDVLLMRFRNDTSAFDGGKIEQLERKGEVNNKFNAHIMRLLQASGVETHFVSLESDHDSLVRSMDMIPVECVVRNYAAGSLCRRLGTEEGIALSPPIFEFFLKNDALHDPMINDTHIISFGWANAEEISAMKTTTLRCNEILSKLFGDAGLLLVDYKLEFGRYQGKLILGDEFSPDGCRLWDAQTRKKLDKDRFRQGLGGVIEGYEEVAQRIGVAL